MIKKAFAGIILACAACCTVPLLIPVLAGASVFGFQLFKSPLSLDTVLCAVAFAALAFAGVYLAIRLFLAWKRKKKSSCAQTSCQTEGKCGCK
jgi:membrane protein implicated in regulation of membrane protease activity